MDIFKNFTYSVIFLLIIILLGTVGFKFIETYYTDEVWTWSDAAFMTVITITSTGYSEVHKLSSAGRMFSCIFQIIGLGLAVYVMSTFTALIVGGLFHEAIRRKKMLNKIKDLKGHFIVCGCGETGIHVVKEIHITNREVVVIENDEERIKFLKEIYPGILIIEGDASDDKTLLDAGIERAHSLVTTLHNDKENLFVTLTARHLNPKLKIITRCIDENSYNKLKRAGATSVVSPNTIGGLRMASELLRPNVVTFLDTMLRSDDSVIRFEEITITDNSFLSNKSLSEAHIQQKTGLLVVAVKDPNKAHPIYNPGGDHKLTPESTLIVMGEVNNLPKLKELAQ